MPDSVCSMCRSRHLPLCLAIDCGAKARDGKTPLMLAACKGNIEVVQLLLQVCAIGKNLKQSTLTGVAQRGLSNLLAPVLK